MEEQRLLFKPESFYEAQDIETHLLSHVEQIDTANKRVTCADDSRYSYDKLIVCTGSSPIRIPVPGSDLEGVFVLRGLDDARTIRTTLDEPRQVVVIGGGYVGLEAASAARQMNHVVTVIERLPKLLSRVTSPVVSDFYADYHRSQGVEVRLETGVSEILGDDHATGVRLDSGEEIAADVVVVGIGVRPNDELAASAGIDCDDGILVDPMTCQTSDGSVYAAGDCARQRLADGTTLRLESVHNALVQADKVAANILGHEAPPYDPPWFWSDQYDVKIQTVGLFNDYDDLLIRGNVDDAKFSVFYLKNGTLIAIDSVNDPKPFMAGKKILKSGVSVTRAQLEDPDVSLKDLALR